MSENNKVLFFVTVMCVVVAGTLASILSATADMASNNEAIFNKREVLKALGKDVLGNEVAKLSDDEVTEIFATKMKSSVAVNLAGDKVKDSDKTPNKDESDPNTIKLEEEKKKADKDKSLPVFIYEDKGEKYYVVSVRGSGLWDAIWGNVALKSDLATVVGVSFDHKGETPGLGAEIKDNKNWVKQFVGTSVLKDGKYVGVNVRKGGAKDRKYEVDGLSGATVTGDGVAKMLKTGIAVYEPYFATLKAGQ